VGGRRDSAVRLQGEVTNVSERIGFSCAAACLAIAVAVLATGPAFAHPGVGEARGLWNGFLHPMLGWDHLTAMLSVGVIAGHLGGRARLRLPASFIASLLAGAGLGLCGASLLLVETGIALSLAALGALVCRLPARPVSSLYAALACFGLFHGFAHGSEAPADASGAFFVLGLGLAAVLVHAAGLALGAVLREDVGAARLTVRGAGCALAVVGTGLALHLV
jgi:urease accessory protein